VISQGPARRYPAENQQVVQIHAEFFGVAGIESVFRVNKGRQPQPAPQMIWRGMVVLPEDSGPKTSVLRHGDPPYPARRQS